MRVRATPNADASLPRDPQELQGLQGAHQQLKVSGDKLGITKKSLEELEKTEEGSVTSPHIAPPARTAPPD